MKQFPGRDTRHTFRQLRQWRDQIEQQLLPTLPDAAWIDLDEARNQVVIGLADGSGSAEVRQALARLGVPAEGVSIEITGRDVPSATLRGRVRPVVGGLGMAATLNGAVHSPWCTYSVNARYNGVDVILTSSHCTQLMYDQDPTPTVFYQRYVTTADKVGGEWLDPPGFGGGCVISPFGYIQHCHRYSDVAMMMIEAGVGFDLGFIVRTTFRSQTWGDTGSVTIADAPNSRFRVVAVQEYPVLGQLVHKVGYTTGWTSGTVAQTCVDVQGTDGWWRDCTYKADYWSDPGDSGSPVFSWSGSGNDVTLVGIHWGKGAYSGFSPMGGVYQDFGAMITEAPVPPEPLSNSIVNSDPDDLYTTSPTGGYPPYISSYWEWCGIDCDGGGGVDLASPANRGGGGPNTIVHGWQFLSTDWTVYWTESHRWLRSTVTDSQGQQAVATYWVP